MAVTVSNSAPFASVASAFTSEEWVDEFISAVTAKAGQVIEHHQAEATLDRLGV